MKRIQTVICMLALLFMGPLVAHSYAETIRCESMNGEYKQCGSGISQAKIARLLSDWPCDKGRTWGLRDGHIWVSTNCRGLFEVQRAEDVRHWLSVSHAGQGFGAITTHPGGIDYPGSPQAVFLYGTAVSLHATPAAGSVFSGWSGDCSGRGDCTILLTKNSSVTAHFERVSIKSALDLLLRKGGWRPTVAITLPTSSPVHTTPSSPLSISGSAGDTVTEVSWSNDRGGSGTCYGTASWDAGGITLAEGLNRITVTVRDAEGYTATDTLAVTYDPTNPAIEITSPTRGPIHRTVSGTLNISGSAADNLGVSLVTWSNDRGDSGTCSGTSAWSARDIVLDDSGPNLITVTAWDAVGNTATDTLTVIYDPANPLIEITSPTTSPTHSTGNGLLSISGTAADNVGVSLVSWSNSRGGSGPCSGTTEWSASGITLYSGGINVITVTARDASNNTTTDRLEVIYDPTNPVVEITSPTSSPTYDAISDTLSIAGTASDNEVVTQVTWSTDRGDSGVCSGTTSWDAPGIPLGYGQTIITVTATDDGGNSSTDTLTVTYDTGVPEVTITSPTSSPTYTTTGSSLNIGGTAADDVGVTQVTWSNNRGGSGICNGTTSWSASGITLYSGSNVITVTAWDAAGNSRQDILTVTRDTGIPSITITSPTSSSTYLTASSSLNIGGTAADDVGVTQVSWSNNRGGSGSCSGTTSWSASGITLYSGSNVITVTARDAAGYTRSDTLTVTRDVALPSITISSPTYSSTYLTTSSSVNISGTAADDVGVTQVTWSNNRGGSGICSGTTSWSASRIILYSGSNVITVTARDAVGYTRSDILTVTRDVALPSITITSPTTGSTYSTSNSSVGIRGSAYDDVGVTQVTWSNSRGGSGTCSGTTLWSATITLYSGSNVITVTARDGVGYTRSDTLTVNYLQPDYIITALSLNQTYVLIGGTINVTYTARNQGNASGNCINMGIYLSTNTTITNYADTELQRWGLPNCNLAPGQSITQTWQVTIPSTTATGYYYIGIIADTDQYQTESNENNNTAASGQIYAYRLL